MFFRLITVKLSHSDNCYTAHFVSLMHGFSRIYIYACKYVYMHAGTHTQSTRVDNKYV